MEPSAAGAARSINLLDGSAWLPQVGCLTVHGRSNTRGKSAGFRRGVLLQPRTAPFQTGRSLAPSSSTRYDASALL